MKTKFQFLFLLMILTPLILLVSSCGSNASVRREALETEIGGEAGALIHQYMDRQAEEIRQSLDGVEVQRVKESILLTFDSGLLFDVGSYQLRPEIRENLVELTKILNKYEDTGILVEGHTDDRGTEEYNQTLSENRAKSVYNQLVRDGVPSVRFTVIGMGESRPIADNNTVEGRQQNRRVEIVIFADKNLKKAAKRGELPID